MAPAREFRVPEADRELLAFPDPDRFQGLIESNRLQVSNMHFDLCGIPLIQLRNGIRKWTVKKALQYTQHLEGWEGLKETSFHTLVMTGHQPLFPHPGILVKNRFLNRLQTSEVGRIGINLVVDSDTLNGCPFSIPEVGERSRTRDFPLFPDEAVRVAEEIGPRTFPPVKKFLVRILQSLRKNDPVPPFLKPFRAFLESIESVPMDHLDLAGSLTLLRRLYERDQGISYLDLPLSVLCGSMEFQIFAFSLLLDADRFARVYNEKLREYRAARKIKNPANPFPDLRMEGDRTETPFWVLRKGSRESLVVERRSDRLVLRGGGKPLVWVPLEDPRSAVARLRWMDIRIRPKAVALSLFTRLVLSDLFIHGVGGAKYDQITDRLAAEFFGTELPPFAAVSATLFLPLGIPDRSDKIRNLKQKFRDMEQHPERFIPKKELRKETRKLVEEQIQIRSRMDLPGEDKKELGKRLSRIGRILRDVLSVRFEETREKIRTLERGQEAVSVASFREYPVFLYPPKKIESLLPDGF